MKVTTSTGIVIDTEEALSKEISSHAINRGLSLIGAVATYTNGNKFYILVEDGEVIKENTSYESMIIYIDMLWADKYMERSHECNNA